MPPFTKLGEVLTGAFNDILRHAGVQVSMDKLSDLRTRCEALGVQLERVVQNKAVETTQKLQVAVSTAFKSYEAELDSLEARIKVLEEAAKKAPKDQ